MTYCLQIGLALFALAALLKQWSGQIDKDSRHAQIAASLGSLPLSFEANLSQTEATSNFCHAVMAINSF
jgi:hypothetical protein